ncbi:MAG: PHP domain-containing protein [Anaerolineales bacterium]
MFIDFHSHTLASKDSLTRPADLIRAARRNGLDRLVVTDHNSIAGARAAFELDPQLIIVGEEIMTTQGEILAAFVREEVPALLSPQETILRLRAQGAFVSVSHPFDEWRKGGWGEKNLLEILPLVDAIEVFNSRCMLARFNQRAKEFAARHNVPVTVGSDAHAAFEAGRAALRVDSFEDADSLRRALGSASVAAARSSSWGVHLLSRYASIRKKMFRGRLASD